MGYAISPRFGHILDPRIAVGLSESNLPGPWIACGVSWDTHAHPKPGVKELLAVIASLVHGRRTA